MKIIEAGIGVYTADGEKVGLAFKDADLVLTFVDWREQPQRHVFRDVLGFRWDGECDEPEIRDDRTYEVVDSPWLARQAHLQSVHAADFAHYKLCFNAAGALDVLCRRIAA